MLPGDATLSLDEPSLRLRLSRHPDHPICARLEQVECSLWRISRATQRRLSACVNAVAVGPAWVHSVVRNLRRTKPPPVIPRPCVPGLAAILCLLLGRTVCN